MTQDPVVLKMQNMVQNWETAGDKRAIFLRCYSLMTHNMLVALEQKRFKDPVWVGQLLERFASYYFVALESFERQDGRTPAVWHLAHHASQQPNTMTVQHLLIGVNTHINYDLVLCVRDMLRPEWASLTPERLAERFSDHCLVNEIIAETTDVVQDTIVEKHTPRLDWVDQLFGAWDEWLISRLITSWRNEVWEQGLELLQKDTDEAEQLYRQEVEEKALQRGRLILGQW